MLTRGMLAGSFRVRRHDPTEAVACEKGSTARLRTTSIAPSVAANLILDVRHGV